MMVGIIDYGVGNLGSIKRAFELLRVSPVLVNRATDIRGNDALILPGVGNFSECMEILRKDGWVNAIKDAVYGAGRPLLGICLGMQLLADVGYEGSIESNIGTEGLGMIPGSVVSLSSEGCSLRIPHVGWNNIIVSESNSPLFRGISDGTDFYFVHSYIFKPDNEQTIIAKSNYDIFFAASVRAGHIWGTQFHPEKSSLAGSRVLYNFLQSVQC